MVECQIIELNESLVPDFQGMVRSLSFGFIAAILLQILTVCVRLNAWGIRVFLKLVSGSLGIPHKL